MIRPIQPERPRGGPLRRPKRLSGWIRCPGIADDPSRFVRWAIGGLAILVGLASIGLAIPTHGVHLARDVEGVPVGITLCVDSLDRPTALEFVIGTARFRAEHDAILSTPVWDPATIEQVFHWSRMPLGEDPNVRLRARGDRVIRAKFWSANPRND
jgi:hypothetical protein